MMKAICYRMRQIGAMLSLAFLAACNHFPQTATKSWVDPTLSGVDAHFLSQQIVQRSKLSLPAANSVVAIHSPTSKPDQLTPLVVQSMRDAGFAVAPNAGQGVPVEYQVSRLDTLIALRLTIGAETFAQAFAYDESGSLRPLSTMTVTRGEP